MGRIWAIAINTFREAVRDKVLYGVLGFACAILVFTLALAELSLHQQRRVVLDVGLASISLFSVVIAIFLGSSLLYKEIERKTLYVILPKPIRRWEFLLGKYVGIAITAAVFISVMGAIQCWVTALQVGAATWMVSALPAVAVAALGGAAWRLRDRTAVLLPWSLGFLGASIAVLATTDVAVVPIVAAMLLTFGEVLVLSAVALLFSSFSTPFLTGALSFGVWLVGRSADEMASMRTDTLGEGVKAMLRALARVVPNFHLFVPGRHALQGEVPLDGGLGGYLATTLGYGLAYAALLLLFAALIFRRRDFL
ncbi:MAG TPA: ABC transporter permease subunit [Sandaracinaceae bacterium LLY-WYZ-13_1]|nr:ABC transporter permease subunit [Sandaracinaceae bacterium LLY-WYZ-13_1]